MTNEISPRGILWRGVDIATLSKPQLIEALRHSLLSHQETRDRLMTIELINERRATND